MKWTDQNHIKSEAQQACEHHNTSSYEGHQVCADCGGRVWSGQDVGADPRPIDELRDDARMEVKAARYIEPYTCPANPDRPYCLHDVLSAYKAGWKESKLP